MVQLSRKNANSGKKFHERRKKYEQRTDPAAGAQLVVDLSVHELAQKTFSSPSTIVRMCMHTGYSGYKEFRREVTSELARREQTLRTSKKEIQHSDSLEQIIDKITFANICSLEETRDLLDVAAV